MRAGEFSNLHARIARRRHFGQRHEPARMAIDIIDKEQFLPSRWCSMWTSRLRHGQATIQLVHGEKIFLENVHLAAGACNQQPTFRCATYLYTESGKSCGTASSRCFHMDALSNRNVLRLRVPECAFDREGRKVFHQRVGGKLRNLLRVKIVEKMG